MVEIRSRLATHPGAPPAPASGRLRLRFELRQKSRLRAALDTGEAVALALPRGTVLRGGDRLVAADGRVIEVVAEVERLVHVGCASPEALARAAYHLGNRHVPVEVGDGWLRIEPDHVLEEMLRGLGATVAPIEAPFEPEAGAYGGGHRHDEMGHGGRIHDHYAEHDHPHPHEHQHKHPHPHPHEHPHPHPGGRPHGRDS